MKKFLICFCVLLFLRNFSEAREPYHVTVQVAAESETLSAPNLVDLSRELRSDHLQALFQFYTPTSFAGLDFNIRGIEAIAFFPAGSSTLVVAIPDTDTVRTFSGATRDDSLLLFKDFIRDGGDHHRLLKAYARHSPIDPIAGNPISLMAQMAQADYLLGHLSPLSGCDCSWSAQPIVHQYQVGTYVTRAFAKPFETTSVTLPLRYSYAPDLKWAFILDAPFTYNRNGGASSVFGSLGVALRMPITHNWALTPIFRTGAGGSLDLCTSGSFALFGLNSVYNYKIKDFVLSMTNYVGYSTSVNLWLTGVNFNYNLHNYIFKNGLSLTSCEGFAFCSKPINFSLSFVDSYFAREHLYIRHFDEIGFSLFTTCLNPCLNYDCLSVGFAYQWGEKEYQAFQFSTVYQF